MTAPVSSPITAPVRRLPTVPTGALPPLSDPTLSPPPPDVGRAELEDAMTMMYLLLNAAYSVVYVSILLSAAAFVFTRRDFK